MGASTLILIVVSPINLALNVYMVHFTPLGLFGSPLAISISYWLCFTGLGVWTYLSSTHKCNGTWGGIQIRAVLNPLSCYQFLKLALPGILMIGTEWFDIIFYADQVQFSSIFFLIKGCIRDSCACSRSSWCGSVGCSISNYDHRSKWVSHLYDNVSANLCISFKYLTFRHWGCRVHARWSTYRASVANRCEECCSCLRAFECHSWGSGNGGNDCL